MERTGPTESELLAGLTTPAPVRSTPRSGSDHVLAVLDANAARNERRQHTDVSIFLIEFHQNSLLSNFIKKK